MLLQLVALYIFSFHFSPYLLVEKSFLKYNCEDSINISTGYAVFQPGDIVAIGSTLQEKAILTNLSIGVSWNENIKFLPYLDINTGVKWRDITCYAGYLLSIKNEYQIKESKSIYSGISYSYKLNNSRLSSDLQLRKGYFSYSVPCLNVDASFVNIIFTNKVEYIFKGYNPFLFLSFDKSGLSGPLSFMAGLGITLGNPTSTTGRYKRVIYYSNVLKPNIYLYPTAPCSVKVMLNPNGRILNSDPPYKKGWQIFAFPDGTIQNSQGYLFYEAQINEMRVTDKGWCINKDEVSSFFYNVLISYGFNRSETNDFVSYWKDRLPNSPFYIIYPVVNKEIDNICLLKIHPKPDVILRVWFVVKCVKQPVTLESVSIPLFKRNGFVVCEWGIIIEREDHVEF